jgi:hypothetical protein
VERDKGIEPTASTLERPRTATIRIPPTVAVSSYRLVL